MFITTSHILHGVASIAMRMPDVDPAGGVLRSLLLSLSSVYLLCRCPYLAGTQEAVLQEGQAEMRAVNDHQQRQARNLSTDCPGMLRPALHMSCSPCPGKLHACRGCCLPQGQLRLLTTVQFLHAFGIVCRV